MVLRKLRSEKRHVFIGGMTRSGKTFAAVEYGRGWPGPVLFFNPQRFPADGYVLADGKTDSLAIVKALKGGYKIQYVPGKKSRAAGPELTVLINLIFDCLPWSPPLLFIVDETHFYCKDGKEGELGDIGRVGIRDGIIGCFVTQTPADTAKVLLRQSDYRLFFKLQLEDMKYLQGKGYPVEDIKRIQEKGEKFSFVLYDGAVVSGPYKV